MEKKVLELVIERAEKGEFWGRVSYNDNLLTDSAPSIAELESKILALLESFENLSPEEVEFSKTYDVYSLFEDFNFINISKFAKFIKINPALLRQYASGVKSPSETQLKRIIDGFHAVGNKMEHVDLVME